MLNHESKLRYLQKGFEEICNCKNSFMGSTKLCQYKFLIDLNNREMTKSQVLLHSITIQISNCDMTKMLVA